MCVIIGIQETLPSLKTLEKCEDTNGDGGGVSWIEGDMVRWKKGIKAKEIHEIIKRQNGNCVAHFRIGTVGGKGMGLCHPFPITKDCKTSLEGEAKRVLFHNGHWHKWEELCFDMVLRNNAYFPGGEWSDSRAMAWILAHSNSSFLKFLKQKVIVQSAKSVLYFGEFEKKDGVYYSNLNWDRTVTTYEYGAYGNGQWHQPSWDKDGKYAVKTKGKEKQKAKDEIEKELKEIKEIDEKYGVDYASQFINPQTGSLY